MKTVFITGADRGIGNAMCEQFLEHGWKVFAGQFMPRWGFLSKNLERYPNDLKLIPDIVLSDIRMPEMDGVTLCRKLRQLAPESTLPIREETWPGQPG